MSEIIRYNSTQKPEGIEYKKITWWNRFVRTKTESVILLFMIIGGISLLCIKLASCI